MRRLIGAAAACALAACAGVRGKPVTVEDADYGRLSPGQTKPVEAARADLGTARDAFARAKLRQQEAQHEYELSMADEKAADAQRMRAEAISREAKESNDPAKLETARAEVETGQLRKRTADAHVEYAKRLQALRDAELAAAQRRVAYQEVHVEQAKLQALQAARIPAAAKYDGGKLEAQVAAAVRDVQDADKAVNAATAEMTDAGRQWQELDRQLQARGGSPTPRG